MLQQLLDDNTISERAIRTWIDQMSAGNEYSDMFFEYMTGESFVLDDNIIKETSLSTSSGVGLRANSGDKTTFAYSDNLDATSIARACDFITHADSMMSASGQPVGAFVSGKTHDLYTTHTPSYNTTNEEKVETLRKINEYVRKNNYVTQVNASISSSYQDILVATSDNTLTTDRRPLVRLNVSVIAHKDGRTEHSSSGGGGRYTYTYFLEHDRYEHYAEEVLRQVMLNLEAKPAPGGAMPVILGAGWPGVLLHEAIGHGLEGDFNRKQTSCFTDKIDTQIASSKCTIVDNGTLQDRRGSLNVDDEGTQTQNTLLVENGILKNYMFDKLNARLMGVKSTGNGRRESYAHIPMPRMTNTYMLPGDENLDEMLASTEEGIYAVNFSGGQVDITSGEFVFTASEAYKIEGGKITHPVKGATLIGKGEEVLKRISMVGNDMALDNGVGVCGKEGQSVPVGVGQPSLKIDELVVGGTEV